MSIYHLRQGYSSVSTSTALNAAWFLHVFAVGVEPSGWRSNFSGVTIMFSSHAQQTHPEAGATASAWLLAPLAPRCEG